MGLPDRGIEIKTPEQIDAMRGPAWSWGGPSSCCGPRSAPGSPPASSTRSPRTTSAPRARRPRSRATTASRRSSARRSTTRSSTASPATGCWPTATSISIDCGAIVDGWHGDAAITVAVGEVPAEVTELMRVTEEAMWRGIAAARLGGRVTDISHAVERYVRSQGSYGILEDYTGHGIGSRDAPAAQRPQLRPPGQGPRLVEGLALAVEPMVTLGEQGDRPPRRRLDGRHRPTAAGPRTSSTPSR